MYSTDGRSSSRAQPARHAATLSVGASERAIAPTTATAATTARATAEASTGFGHERCGRGVGVSPRVHVAERRGSRQRHSRRFARRHVSQVLDLVHKPGEHARSRKHARHAVLLEQGAPSNATGLTTRAIHTDRPLTIQQPSTAAGARAGAISTARGSEFLALPGRAAFLVLGRRTRPAPSCALAQATEDWSRDACGRGRRRRAGGRTLRCGWCNVGVGLRRLCAGGLFDQHQEPACRWHMSLAS